MSNTRQLPAMPTVNRMVHYVAHGSADGTYPSVCRAAVVVGVGAWLDEETRGLDESVDYQRRVVVQRWDPLAVAMHVLNPTGLFINDRIAYHGGDPLGAIYGDHHEPGRSLLCTGMHHPGGTWHWPVMA